MWAFLTWDLYILFDRAPVTTADAGQCVSFALKRVKRDTVRKGMVIVSKNEAPPRGMSWWPRSLTRMSDLF